MRVSFRLITGYQLPMVEIMKEQNPNPGTPQPSLCQAVQGETAISVGMRQ